jgi:hypothetical protein
MAIAVLARSLEREPGEGSPLQRALEAIAIYDHSAAAAEAIAAALREAYRAALLRQEIQP